MATGRPNLTQIKDVHQYTLDHDRGFQAFMDTMYATDWRQRFTPKEQRNFAKAWNFARCYGSGNDLSPDDIRRLLDRSNRSNAE